MKKALLEAAFPTKLTRIQSIVLVVYALIGSYALSDWLGKQAYKYTNS
jgi:hypothetical protein